MDKITWVQWTTLGVQALTILGVFLSWYFVPLFTERRRKEAETEMWQHVSMSNSHRNLIAVFHDLEQQIEVLMLKYNCVADDLVEKISEEERNNLNAFVVKINKELEMIYTLMPDNKYRVFKDKFPIGQTTLTDRKESLLVAMRQSQFPKTKFSKKGDIRLIYKLKKPLGIKR